MNTMTVFYTYGNGYGILSQSKDVLAYIIPWLIDRSMRYLAQIKKSYRGKFSRLQGKNCQGLIH